MSARPRVLVLGAGPAGLAAAARLVQGGRGRVSVRIAHMGHHVGGKAASYRGPDGGLVEHGWHMVLGFYRRMRALMSWAGLDPERVLVSMDGQSHAYERSNGRLNPISSRGSELAVALRFLGYAGMPLADRMNYGRFMAQAIGIAQSGEDLRKHDDICFSTWAIEHGLRPHVTRYSLFRFLREAYFNFPEQMSAYHMLQTLRLMGSPEHGEAFVARGGTSERIWDPIARRLESAGCPIEPYVLATDWVYEGRRIVGVAVGRPDSRGHDDGQGPWRPRRIPAEPGTERILRDFDWVISTIPHAVFVGMNAADHRLWQSPFFRRLKNLRSAATVSMTVETTRAVMDVPGPVFGLPAPLGTCTNMKRYLDGARADASRGSVLNFVGQEAGFEEWTDEQIVSFTLANLSRVAEVGDVRAAGIRRVEIHRNRSDHERLLLCEPGIQRFRPGAATPFSNLLLAGDWVRNDVDLICMEGAIASGEAAADRIVEELAA